MGQIVGYTRVSLDTQAEHGEGLEIQQAAIEAWAAAKGRRIARWYTEAVSGRADLSARYELGNAINDLEPGDTLVVARLDRLARDLIAQETLLGQVWTKGAKVVSCVESEAIVLQIDDPKDPSRKLIRQVLGAVNEYERAIIRLRLDAGRKRKREREGWDTGSTPIERVYVPKEHMAYLTVEGLEMYDFVIQARDEGKTWRAIQVEFTERFRPFGLGSLYRLHKRAVAHREREARKAQAG
jgi:DNA invertase Pin-like site-specific DNA recombinase